MNLVSLILVWAGLAVSVPAAVGLLTMPGIRRRLHYVGALTTVGAPLVVVGLIVGAQTTSDALKLAVIGLLLAATGPVTVVAVAKAIGPPHE